MGRIGVSWMLLAMSLAAQDRSPGLVGSELRAEDRAVGSELDAHIGRGASLLPADHTPMCVYVRGARNVMALSGAGWRGGRWQAQRETTGPLAAADCCTWARWARTARTVLSG